MGIDLSDNNNTRYYSVPDHADLTFPDSGWFLSMWTNVNNNDGSAFQYLFSNRGAGSVNSLNILLREASASSPNKWAAQTSSFLQSTTASPGADNVNRLIVLQRNGSNLEMWFAELGQTATKEIDAAFSDGAIDGDFWNIGRRVDGNTDRYYENPFGDVIKGSVTLTQAQIELLALGVPPTLVTSPANLDVWFQFREQTATVVDIINGHVATRNGTGLLTVEHFPVVSGTMAVISAAAVAPTIRAPQLTLLGVG